MEYEKIDDLGVQLYWAKVEELSAKKEAQIQQIMSPGETQRCERYRHEPSRRCCLVTRHLVRTTLSELGERAPREWVFATEAQGRPFLKNPTKRLQKLDFNIAHSSQQVVLAVTFGGRVGVDLEPVQRRVDHDLVAKKFFHDDEIQSLEELDGAARRRRFLELWVLKEAWMKADGRGMGAGLSEVVFDFDDHGKPELASAPDAQVHRWRVVLGEQEDHLVALVYGEDRTHPDLRCRENS